MKGISEKWYVYMLECSDGSIYTGISNDVQARIDSHNAGKGAKYTKGRRPVKLKITFEYENRSEASKAEHAYKKLSKEEKWKVISRPKNVNQHT